MAGETANKLLNYFITDPVTAGVVAMLFIMALTWQRSETTLLRHANHHSFKNLNLYKSLNKSVMANKIRPQLIVFDLDYTLWPFWVDTHVTPPFKRDKKGDVVDYTNRKIKAFPEVDSVLEKLHNEGYTIAAASRTSEIDGANQLLDLFGWNKYFTYKEIYPGCKKTHFAQFKKKSGIEFKDMLFFDDEYRNIRDLKEVGVTSIHVNQHQGITWSVIEEGLKEFQNVAKK